MPKKSDATQKTGFVFTSWMAPWRASPAYLGAGQVYHAHHQCHRSYTYLQLRLPLPKFQVHVLLVLTSLKVSCSSVVDSCSKVPCTLLVKPGSLTCRKQWSLSACHEQPQSEKPGLFWLIHRTLLPCIRTLSWGRGGRRTTAGCISGESLRSRICIRISPLVVAGLSLH